MMNYDRYHKMRPHTYHPTFLLSNSKPAFRQEHRGVSHSNYVMKWGFTRRNGPPEHQARTHSDVTGHLAHGRPWLSRQVYRLTLELLAVLPSFLHDTPFDPRWAFSEVSTQPGDLHSSLVPCEHLLYLKSGVSTQPGELHWEGDPEARKEERREKLERGRKRRELINRARQQKAA